MLIWLIIALLCGMLAGTVTGLIPGLHINLLGAVLTSISFSFLPSIKPIVFAVFLVSMAITHTFIDFIPSVLLGAPDTDTVLSILPGHKFLREGRGHEAILLTVLGSFFATFILFFLSILSIFFLPLFYQKIRATIPFILFLSSIFLIFQEKRKCLAFAIFLLSGILGIGVLTSPSIKEPLLAMLTGLFGASNLIISIKHSPSISFQKTTNFKKVIKKLAKKNLFPPLLASAIFSPFCSFLPGLGSGQAAVLGSSVFRKISRQEFLILLGAINTLVIGLSFTAFYSVGIARTGTADTLSKLLPAISFNQLVLLFFVILLTGIVCLFWTNILSAFIIGKIKKIQYPLLSKIVLAFIILLVLVFSNAVGFFAFLLSTIIGIFGISLGVRRINFMGCLIIPVIFFYLA